MCRRYSVTYQITIALVVSVMILMSIALGYLSILRGEILSERKSRLVNIIDKTEAIFQRYNLYYHLRTLKIRP